MTDRTQSLRRGPGSWKGRWISLSHWIVTLLVSFIAWISEPYNRARRYIHESWLSRVTAWRSRKKRGHPGGRRPKEPKVLGVVLLQQSFRAQDDQALSRILTWAKQQGFLLCTLYCPYDGIHSRFDSIKNSMQWAEPQEFEISESPSGDLGPTQNRKVEIWQGWDAPAEWVYAIQHSSESGSKRLPMGVALLSAKHAEVPLAMMVQNEDTSPARGDVSSESSLERALQAPISLKQAISSTAGPVATMDPDIIMIFGGIPSLAGYPSWSARSSEIYDMGQLGVITRGKLEAALKRYKVTKQRFGR